MSIEQKACSRCGRATPLEQFYSKGNRLDSRCKSCVKDVRRASYKRKRKHWGSKITKVTVKEVVPENLESFRREMKVVETILMNLIYKALSRQIKPETEIESHQRE